MIKNFDQEKSWVIHWIKTKKSGTRNVYLVSCPDFSGPFVKVSLFRNVNLVPSILPKTNEKNSTYLVWHVGWNPSNIIVPQVESFSFIVFWRNWRHQKRHFEVNWPLGRENEWLENKDKSCYWLDFPIGSLTRRQHKANNSLLCSLQGYQVKAKPCWALTTFYNVLL